MEAESLISNGLQPQQCSISEQTATTPSVERQFAMISSRLKGKNGCNWREREYAQLCVRDG